MNSTHPYNEEVVRLCTRIRSVIVDAHKSVLLTGVSERDPVGLIAYEVSRTFVLLGDGPVLLVDANFSRPRPVPAVADPPGVSPIDSPGLLDVLRQTKSLSEATFPDQLPGLFHLGTGSKEGDYHSLLLSDQCGELLKEMRQDYAYVVIESAPIVAHSECLRLAGRVDGVAVVVQAEMHQQSDLLEVKQAIDGFQLPFLGVILSAAPVAKSRP